LLQRFGGHRSAAGITIARERVEEFAARFNAVAASRLTEDDLIPELRVDLELPLAEANAELETLLRYIEPCGVGNPSPLLVSRGLVVASPPRVVGKDGLKVAFSDEGRTLVMVGWGMAPRARELDVGMRADVAYRLERDDWNGESRLQGRLADFRV
jgi:single-stranded-DNA-specific exonuclease